MILRVAFQPAAPAHGRALYIPAEFALDYTHSDGDESPDITPLDASLNIRAPRWLIMAGTLTLTFSGRDSVLRSLDAYTNWQQWEHVATMIAPGAATAGRLSLADSPSDDDRVNLGEAPHYTYAEDTRLLRITLSSRSESVPTYYVISDRLLVGIDQDRLSCLYLTDLEIQQA